MTYYRDPRPFHICECKKHAFASSTKGYVFWVSPEDVEDLDSYNWCIIISQGRAIPARRDRSRKPQMRYISREIMDANPDQIVDHKNGNSLDNTRGNLRVCTQSQNLMNKRVAYGSSKFKGVCWDKSRDKWIATIRSNGTVKNLGRFDKEEDAAKAYDKAARKKFGEFSATNKELGILVD